MVAHRTLFDMRRAPFAMVDPGDAGSIVPDRWGAVCPIVSTAAETRTLAQPTKPGMQCTLVLKTDGGDVTVTVTGGYNIDDDTTLVFSEAGEWVEFSSVDIGGSYYWRITGREGAKKVAAEHGAGAIGTGVAPATYRWKQDDGTIITEIKVDLTGLACKGDAAKDAIGLAAGGAAYIGRYVTATCGIVYRVEMSCLELPGEGTATITTDIDLGAEDVGTTAYDGAVDDVVIDTGGIVAGATYVDDAPALTANDYLYLVEGDTTAATGVYNAGQIVVRLYGHPLLS